MLYVVLMSNAESQMQSTKLYMNGFRLRDYYLFIFSKAVAQYARSGRLLMSDTWIS